MRRFCVTSLLCLHLLHPSLPSSHDTFLFLISPGLSGACKHRDWAQCLDDPRYNMKWIEQPHSRTHSHTHTLIQPHIWLLIFPSELFHLNNSANRATLPSSEPFCPPAPTTSAEGPWLCNCTRFLHAHSTGQRAHTEQAPIVSSEVQHSEKFLVEQSTRYTHLEQIWQRVMKRLQSSVQVKFCSLLVSEPAVHFWSSSIIFPLKDKFMLERQDTL